MADPCQVACSDVLCVVIEKAEHVIFGYFFVEMLIAMVAMGICGCNSYLSDPWNRFDFFIVMAGLAEYLFLDQNVNIQAIRSLRMLRSLRAITRIPSLRLLVSLFLDTLPMLGNVFILFVFLYFAFGIVAVSLWAGLLRNRCFFSRTTPDPPGFLPPFYRKPDDHQVYLCTRNFGMQACREIPEFEKEKASMCRTMFAADPERMLVCQRWVGNYTDCRTEGENPHFGNLNFDNLGYAFITLFQVISLEGWSDVMYYLQDTFSFHVWIYFVLLIMCGYYFAVKLCLVVIAAQFSVTRERQRLEKERRQKLRGADMEDLEDDGFYTQVCDLIEYGFRTCLEKVCRRKLKPVVIHQLIVAQSKAVEKKRPLSKTAKSRQWIRRHMDGSLAQNIAAGLILLNAAIMACEHHDEPEELGLFAEVSNVFFTVIFAVEILLRLYGWGLRDFVREGFNMLDLVVSVVNVIELAGASRSGLTVLRLFRILRLVKLFRFVPSLQRNLLLMLHTIDNATAYFCFFGFAMYVSALFGMSLFGCKVCKETPEAGCGSSNCTANSMIEEECTNKDFNSLRQSLLTVLRVFARDQWTSVMHVSMFKVGTWAVVYFIILVILADYIFLNLLTGILVEGFGLKEGESPAETNETRHKDDNSRHFSPPYCQCVSVIIAKMRLLFDGCDSDTSLFLFKTDSVIRNKLRKIVSSPIWDVVFFLFIVASCILLIVEQPNVGRTKNERLLLSLTSYCITAAFSIEALSKIIANGFILGEGTYMRRASNIFDFGLVCLALGDIVVYAMNSKFENRTLVHVLRPIRLLRALRPLRIISRAESLRTVLQTLIISVKAIGQIVVICCFFFAIFAVLGVQLFHGCYGKCQLPPDTSSNGTIVDHTGNSTEELLRSVKSRSECVAVGLYWQIEEYNFNSFVNALTSLFILATFNGWVDIPTGAVGCVGPDLAPKPDHNFWVYIYFVSFLLVGCFFALNMFVGVVVNNYQRVSKLMRARPREIHHSARYGIRRLSEKLLSKCVVASAFQEEDKSAYWEAYPKWRLCLLEVTSLPIFEYAIMTSVVLNIFCMSLEHYQMDPLLAKWLVYLNYVFVGLLTMEMLLKVIAQGFYRYCKNSWNRLDIVVSVSSLTGIVFDNLEGATLPVDPSVIRIARIFRIFRIIKLVKVAKGLRTLMKTVTNAVPQIANLSVLFLLLFFIYGTLGVQLFGRFDSYYEKCDGLSRHSNFTSFGMALLTLFRVFTGDAWNLLLKDLLRMSASFCRVDHSTSVPCSVVEAVAPLYFISFLLLSQFILINIVVAMLMEQIYFLHRKTKENERNERGKMRTVSHLVQLAHGSLVEEVNERNVPRASLQNHVNLKSQLVTVTVHGSTVNLTADSRNKVILDIDGRTLHQKAPSNALFNPRPLRRVSSCPTLLTSEYRQLARNVSFPATGSNNSTMGMDFPDISCNLREFASQQFVTDHSEMKAKRVIAKVQAKSVCERMSVVSDSNATATWDVMSMRMGAPDISADLKEFDSQQFVTDEYTMVKTWTCEL